MLVELKELVILGVTESGEILAVPNWPERLCGMLAKQGEDNRVHYSNYLRPAHINGIPAVVMQNSLEQEDRESFVAVQQFVAEHRLKTRSGRIGDATSKYPAVPQERREYIKG